MAAQQTVLLVGGTGRTGRRVLVQLVAGGVGVRAIVRSTRGLPAGMVGNPGVALIEGSLLSLSDQALQGHLRGCDAVISCLGHVLTVRGVLGPPRDLVTRATTRLCRAIEALRPARPTRFILMSSVSVHRPGGLDTRRGAPERAFLWLLRGLLPPARDNQQAADFLQERIGPAHPFVQWVVVRPDTLLEGEVSEYRVHEGLVNSLRAPGQTNMANVAHFMCELATRPKAWADWKGKAPVIVNAAAVGPSTEE
jgi:nucleoside-diphosphate-sugar epimerase